MVQESELVRALRSHKGLNDLQMWRMRDEAANRIAAIEAQNAGLLDQVLELENLRDALEAQLDEMGKTEREIEYDVYSKIRVAFRRALSELPEIAPLEIRRVLSSVHMRDEFLNEGKRLQRTHGTDAVAPRLEQECGAGAWLFMRNGILSALEATPPAPKVTGDPLDEMEERIEAYLAASQEDAPKVTDADMDDAAVAALVALARHNIPTDIQELLVRGDPMRSIPPGALSKSFAAALKALTAAQEAGKP